MGDNTIELVDLLESYLPISTPGFQTLISAKKEFAELASTTTETLPEGRGNFFKHQIFTHRYLRAYDRLMIMSETGTGKSCEAIGFIEYTRKEMAKAEIDPRTADEKASHFKRVIVLVKGPTQKNEFRQQLVCKCSDGGYEPSMGAFVPGQKNPEAGQKSRVTTAIKKAGYEVKTYTSFANAIAKEYEKPDGAETIIKEYSDTIFWLDEAHNLLSSSRSVTKIREKERTYNTIWTLLHMTLRTKIIISTATPMINEDYEIGPLFNLILPVDGVLPPGFDLRLVTENDRRVLFPDIPFDPRTSTPEQAGPYYRGQFPSDREFDFSTATLQDFEPRFRGRVGYIRASETGAVPVNEGIHQGGVYYDDAGNEYESQLVIYTNDMSEHQNAGYLLSKQTQTQRGEIYTAERQASNFVFPDGYWGGGISEEERARERRIRQAQKKAKEEQITEIEQLPEGGFVPVGLVGQETEIDTDPTKRKAFARYVKKVGDRYFPTEEFAPWLTDINYITTLSCKFGQICRLVRDEPGNCFVYGEYVEGSGAVVLGLCLEGLGFERYNESRSMFLGIGDTTVKPYCSGAAQTATNRRVRPDFLSRKEGGPLRYALLTGETAGNDAKFQSMMEAMNSYENRHGDYIKVLISSRVGRDGINVNNVLQIHLIGSEWNQSSIYQALSRGLRATSHEDLLNEKRADLISKGENPMNATIPVKIYRHAAVSLTDGHNSVDLHMYRTTEYKDRKIHRIMRFMKQCAVGCQVHYNRNVRPGDVDGSPTCDYDVCNYECVDPAPMQIDYSTYDVLYADEVVSEVLADIVNAFRQRNALTLDEIAQLLPTYRKKYLIMALEELIIKKIALTDRFGYIVYLREDDGGFYLDRSYPVQDDPSYAMSYYTKGVIGLEPKNLPEIVTEMEEGDHDETITELETMNPQSAEFTEEMNTLSVEGQAALVESVLTRYARGERNPFIQAVMDKFARFIFIIHEPVTELNKLYLEKAQPAPRRGRKENPETKRRVKKINATALDQGLITWDTATETVYLHTVYTQNTGRTAYNTVARINKAEGRIRLLKMSEDIGWRDLNEIEKTVYNIILQIKITERNQVFVQQGLYGFVSADGFRIADRRSEKPGSDTDGRKVNRGKICTTWSRPDLIDISWEVGVPEVTGYPQYTEPNRQQLINIILSKRSNKTAAELQTWDIQRLSYYAKFYQASSIHRPEMCEHIKQRMATTGRLQQ